MHNDNSTENMVNDSIELPTPAQIYGASAFESAADGAATPSDDAAVGESTTSLPMIVWLRGDEPIADEFVIDAEGAMQMLGIKRSRLTQISGRELRVGRIRIDRYTRPMYRMADILEYKQWTRATATHARASAAINDAAKHLEDRAEALNDRFEKAIGACTTSIQDLVEQENHRMLEAQLDRMNQIEETLCRTAVMSGEGLQSNLAELGNSLTALNDKADGIANVQSELQKLQVAIEHINNLTIDLHTNVKSGQQMQLQFNRDIGKALSLIIEFQRETTKAHTNAMQQLHQNMEQIQHQLAVLGELHPITVSLHKMQTHATAFMPAKADVDVV